MQEIIKTFATLWGTLSTARKAYLVGSIILVIAALMVIVYFSSIPNYNILYSGMDAEEASQVAQFLDERGVPYKVQNNGQTITIPSGKVHEMRMALATEGIPQSGSSGKNEGFMLLDQPSFGLSDRQQEINYQRALQGEIARTIKQMPEVKDARVMIVTPKKALFVKEQEPAKASVFLRLQRGKDLSERQIKGIRFFVSHAVEGLDPGNVTIVDSTGRALATDEISDGNMSLNGAQLRVRKEYEQHLTGSAQMMLDSVMGLEQSVVRVSVELDFNSTQTTSESFDTKNVVVKNEKSQSETSRSTSSGTDSPAGVTSNEPKAQATATSGTRQSSEQNRENTENTYEIPRVIEVKQRNTPDIRRLSVAVFINKKTDANGTVISRTPEELAKIEQIVRNAVGIVQAGTRQDSITIEEVAFADNFAEKTEATPWNPKTIEETLIKYMPYISQGSLIILALAILLWFRSVVKSAPKKEDDTHAFDDLMMEVERLRNVGEAALAEKEAAEEEDLPKTLTVNEISRLIQDHPDNTSLAIKNWLARN